MGHHAHTPSVSDHADQWHHHASVEGAPQREHTSVINTGSLARWFVLLVATLVIVIVAISVYFTSAVTHQKARVVESAVLSAESRTEKERTAVVLATGTDPHAGKMQAPISDAMDKVIARYAPKK